ncbi:MAG: hypothetical protein IMW90_17935 [Thermogemmatispora sp.]|jgi:hypothetical protein|uniref:Uncharacterized protein n=1 Tax=Thermogemmatispora aurantia TaxID=2045279 RepID=A0A5J4K6E4_9CHLR|nr:MULTISPECIES: hypothetical protein [Thermogemmatispora]MBE3567599.1 hypothetical protein [Thermogemmatispora sp.]GER81716.1 hypothetical protein KTAU_03540 [Thermogemmatispora aurantia]
MAESEVARLRRQIEEEYAAAFWGLTGLACWARHDFINARMGRLAELEEALSEHIGLVRAQEEMAEAYQRQRQQVLVMREERTAGDGRK